MNINMTGFIQTATFLDNVNSHAFLDVIVYRNKLKNCSYQQVYKSKQGHTYMKSTKIGVKHVVTYSNDGPTN